MTPNLNSSDNLFVANLQSVSLEKLVKSKLEVLFAQQKEAQAARDNAKARFDQAAASVQKEL